MVWYGIISTTFGKKSKFGVQCFKWVYKIEKFQWFARDKESG